MAFEGFPNDLLGLDLDNHEQTAAIQAPRVGVKVPPIWREKIDTWFQVFESHLLIGKVTSDEARYHHLVAHIDSSVAGHVADILAAPPANGKYKTLKDRLIERFGKDHDSRIRSLLSAIQLGDRRPSFLLQDMRNVNNAILAEDVVKTLWISRLPETIRHIILASDNLPLDELAKIADRISDSSQPKAPPIACEVVNTNAVLRDLVAEIRQLSVRVGALESKRSESIGSRSRPWRRSVSRGRQSRSRAHTPIHPDSSETRDTQDLCWYHANFGSRATHCRDGCTFQAKN